MRLSGTTFWPGSHKRMYYAFEHESNPGANPQYQEIFAKAVAEIEPVEMVGGAGDVIFWHGRMLHSAGIHHGSGVRFAIPADFQQGGRATVASRCVFVLFISVHFCDFCDFSVFLFFL